jgi:hypothetical protein
MELDAFTKSLDAAAPPAGIGLALEALWWDAKGDWATAHERAQAQDDASGALVHAYLHRKEGDLSNAGYWYRRAGRAVCGDELPVEWTAIARELLAQPQSR